ncbi:MAG: hypothetical protein EXR79_10300 [Myxococcales bacterium]|nr:hypothetical protein [Myxococcales bacterium]
MGPCRRHLAASFVATLTVLACTGSRSAAAIPPESSSSAGAWRVEVVDGGGRPLDTFWRDGRAYVLGGEGQRYRIRLYNQSSRRIEAVVSVDGRDAIDGRSASFDKPGYIVPAWGSVTIDGFRLSLRDVAAFRFSPVEDSYAAQVGDARNVGVIGVAVFTERARRPRPPLYRAPEPAPYPCPGCDAEDGGWGRRESGEAAGATRDQAPAKAAAPAPADASPGARAGADNSEAKRGRAYGGLGDGDGAGGASGGWAPSPPRPESRPGLGTAFGERDTSPASTVQFQRAHHSPQAVLAVRYNDRQGLLALGIDVDRRQRVWPQWDERYQRETARPFGEMPFAASPPGWSR